MMHLLEGQKNIAYLSRIEELLEGIYERLSVYLYSYIYVVKGPLA